jgi:hypothetical protein
MRTSWKLINKELCTDHENHGIESVNIDGRSSANQQMIADSFINTFTTILYMINKVINANYRVTNASVNNHNTLTYSLKHALQNSFTSINYNCTTTREIENIIMSLKSSNSFCNIKVPTKIRRD